MFVEESVFLRIAFSIVSHPKTKRLPYYLQQDYVMQKFTEEDTSKFQLLAKLKPSENAHYQLSYRSQNQELSVGLS